MERCVAMKSRTHSNEFKEQVVKEYLSGGGLNALARQHGINKTQIKRWTEKWRKYGCFPDGRGKAKGGGRPRKADVASMSRDEYIAYLEMENAILKRLSSLNNNLPK